MSVAIKLESQSKKTYAGIGSRETPEAVLLRMRGLAVHLYVEGWTLRSGKAKGADEAFEAGVDAIAATKGENPHERKQIMLPWRGYNGSFSRYNPSEMPFTLQEERIAAGFHPSWKDCSEAARKFHIRNGRIMYGAEITNAQLIKFLICWTKDGQVTGGTGQALRIAFAHDIPVFNLGKCSTNEELDKMLLEVSEYQRHFE